MFEILFIFRHPLPSKAEISLVMLMSCYRATFNLSKDRMTLKVHNGPRIDFGKALVISQGISRAVLELTATKYSGDRFIEVMQINELTQDT